MPFRFHAVTAIFALATLAATGSARAESGFQEVDATLSAAQESVQACSAEAAALASTRARLRNVTLPVVGKLIVVNVAGQVLTGYRDGMPEIEMRVIVGRTDRQTAELQTEVSFVRVNPSARLGCVPAQGLGDQRPLGPFTPCWDAASPQPKLYILVVGAQLVKIILLYPSISCGIGRRLPAPARRYPQCSRVS
jgi:hypothetical protein